MVSLGIWNTPAAGHIASKATQTSARSRLVSPFHATFRLDGRAIAANVLKPETSRTSQREPGTHRDHAIRRDRRRNSAIPPHGIPDDHPRAAAKSSLLGAGRAGADHLFLSGGLTRRFSGAPRN